MQRLLEGGLLKTISVYLAKDTLSSDIPLVPGACRKTLVMYDTKGYRYKQAGEKSLAAVRKLSILLRVQLLN